MVGFIILIVIVGAAYYFYKSSPMGDPSVVKNRCKGRTEEQRKVIRYFCVDGCLTKTISDEQYMAIVEAQLAKTDFKAKGISKVGLDESELKEIEPVHFEGFVFDKNSFSKQLKKGNKWVSSKYQISWLFFSDKQVYLYQYTFNLDEDGKKEATEEYFYRDITNFATSSDTVEASYWDKKAKKELIRNVDSNRFALTVPGDKFFCSLEQNDYTERAIQAMKAKLREKKG